MLLHNAETQIQKTTQIRMYLRIVRCIVGFSLWIDIELKGNKGKEERLTSGECVS